MTGIQQLPTVLPAQVGILPQMKRMVTTDSLATITTAGYLNSVDLQSNPIQASDVLDVLYSYNLQTNSGTFGIFTVSIANGVITLVQWANPGDVLLPVVSGDFANFNGTTGQIKDAGFSPTDAAKTKVVMLNAAPTINHVAIFTNANGTIGDGGVLGTAAAKAASDNTKATVASVNGATIVNHIATYSDTAGTVSEDAATAINGGNIQAGLSGTAGTLASFPATASKGSLVLAGVANTGDTITTVSNAAMGQASVISIPDPAGATANFALAPSALVSGNLVKASGTAGLLVDQGVAFKSVAQAAVAGGAAAQTVTDAFCTTGSMVTASWNDTTNAVTIQKVAAGNGSFVVTSSGDPGSSHLNYIITK